MVASERDRPDVARRRQQWTTYQGRIDPTRLVFIDETWTKTNMAPLRGWGPLGQRLPAKVPHGRWTTMTFLAALRHDRVDAPWLLEGPINGESFRLYVEQVLIPTLQPRDIVVMDNLGSHKSSAVRRALRAVGSKALLPTQVLARPEPDRDALLEAQIQPAQGRTTHPRRNLQRYRRPIAYRPARRVRQLFRKSRIRSNLESSRSSLRTLTLRALVDDAPRLAH